MKKERRRKKCVCCKQWFHPDPRSHPRQRFCSKDRCQKSRKAARQRRWHARPENREYWCGPDRVKKTQEWRKKNPGYSRGKGKRRQRQQGEDWAGGGAKGGDFRPLQVCIP